MGTHICKDCHNPFYLRPDQERSYTKKRLGQPQLSVPVRCPDCIVIHREKVKNLGRVIVKIQGAKSGEGCFVGLTKADIPTLRSWGSNFVWQSVIPDVYPSEPTAISFNVDDKLVGALAFVDQGFDLFVQALEYAPRIEQRYGDYFRSFILYMISESFRRGYDGGFYITPSQKDRGRYEQLGFRPYLHGNNGEYYLPAETALMMLLKDEGVSDEVIWVLVNRAKAGDADLGWIAGKLSKGKITVQMVEAITKAKFGINWNILKLVVGNPSLLRDKYGRGGSFARKLQGLFGQLQAVEYLLSLDQTAVQKMEIKMMSQSVDIIIKFNADAVIRRCMVYDSKTQTVQSTSLRIAAGQGSGVEVKAWKSRSYSYPDKIEELIDEIRQARSVVNTTLVMVTADFLRLPEEKQLEIVRRVHEAGGLLKTLPNFTAGNAATAVGHFVRKLA